MQTVTRHRIILSERDEVTFILPYSDDKQQDPVIYYNGSEYAVFAKQPEHYVKLTDIPDAVAHKLAFADMVHIIEVDGEDDDRIIFEYDARCVFDSAIAV